MGALHKYVGGTVRQAGEAGRGGTAAAATRSRRWLELQLELQLELKLSTCAPRHCLRRLTRLLSATDVSQGAVPTFEAPTLTAEQLESMNDEQRQQLLELRSAAYDPDKDGG